MVLVSINNSNTVSSTWCTTFALKLLSYQKASRACYEVKKRKKKERKSEFVQGIQFLQTKMTWMHITFQLASEIWRQRGLCRTENLWRLNWAAVLLYLCCFQQKDDFQSSMSQMPLQDFLSSAFSSDGRVKIPATRVFHTHLTHNLLWLWCLWHRDNPESGLPS